MDLQPAVYPEAHLCSDAVKTTKITPNIIMIPSIEQINGAIIFRAAEVQSQIR